MCIIFVGKNILIIGKKYTFYDSNSLKNECISSFFMEWATDKYVDIEV